MRKRGFALIEVLVSIFILATVALAVAGAFVSAIKSVTYTKDVIAATALANVEIEKLHNMPYNDLATAGSNMSPMPPYPLPVDKTVTSADITFNVQTVIKYYDDPKDGIAPADIAPNDYKIISISVNLPNKPALVTLNTDIADKNTETAPGTGVLSVCVINALPPYRDPGGNPVGAATVTATHTLDNSTTSVVTDVISGCVMIANLAPDSQNRYHVVVSKTGYSTDQTYSLADYPNTNKPDLNIMVGEVERATFIIDQIAQMDIQLVDVDGNKIGQTIIDNNTKSLLHFNGDNGSTTFTDETGKQWLASAPGPEISNGASVFNQVLQKESPQYIYTNDQADFNTGTGNLTIEAWVRVTGAIGAIDILNKYQDDNNFYRFSLTDTGCSSGQSRLEFVAKTGGTTIANNQTACQNVNFSPSTFHHLAFTRNNNGTLDTTRFFLDGVGIFAQVAGNIALNKRSINNTGQARMSSSGGSAHYIDEFRFSNIDRSYKDPKTSKMVFSPPAAEYTMSTTSSPNPAFTLQGAKMIVNSFPYAYKYSVRQPTDDNGYIAIPNLEFDVYSLLNIICGGNTYYVAAISGGNPITLYPSGNLSTIVTLTKTLTNPTIARINPVSSQTNQPVTINVIGSNFKNGLTTKLYRLQPDRVEIIGTPSIVNANELNITFNLTGAMATKWNLEIINPTTEKVVSFNSFEVKN